jgi:hypothetical protein
MPDSGIAIDVDLRETQRRKIGGLLDSEMWWRNHYHDVEARGYRLRARYHPDWQPSRSWEGWGQDFLNTEDGQATIVSIRWLVLQCKVDFSDLSATRIYSGYSSLKTHPFSMKQGAF